jgi:exonuclease SbcD
MAFDEAAYRHQIAIVEIGDGPAVVRSEPVPRAVELLRIRGELDEVVAELETCVPLGDAFDPARPLLDVAVVLPRPEPRLRARVEAALDGKRPRLVRLTAEQTGDGAALAEAVTACRLAELDPRDVFARCWSRRHALPPAPAVLAAFERLLADAEATS